MHQYFVGAVHVEYLAAMAPPETAARLARAMVPLGGNRAYLVIIRRDPKKVLEILRSINASRRTKKAA